MKPTPETLLANAAEGGSPFVILQGDEFVVPYGNFPHKVGLQIFDRKAADDMVKAHNSTLSKVVNFIKGGGNTYPVYIGHPDIPGTKDQDKRAYGWIENMRAEDDGLHFGVKWSAAGRELVENAHFKFYSPLWWVKKNKGNAVPIGLKSMGLTNDPNIPVPALANEHAAETAEESQHEETETENEDMNPEILKALGLDETATAADVLAKILQLKKPAAKPAAEKPAAEKPDAKPAAAEKPADEKPADEKPAAEKPAAEAKPAAEKPAAEMTEMEKAEEEIEKLKKENLAAGEKVKGAANAALDAAVQAGRITPAEKGAKLVEILAANDIGEAITGLGKLEAKVKIASTTGNLGSAKARLVIAANDDSKAAKVERAQLVENEFQATNAALSKGERKRIAWQRAQSKNPELFGKKESPGPVA
jgi:hypothetical protein